MLKEIEIAEFSSVMYNSDADDVFVTFKVISPDYKDFVMRWASRKDGRLIIRGDKLLVVDNGELDADI